MKVQSGLEMTVLRDLYYISASPAATTLKAQPVRSYNTFNAVSCVQLATQRRGTPRAPGL